MPKYGGTGSAKMLNTNAQATLISNERPGPGSPSYASIAVYLERQKSASYPWGFAVEVAFQAAPGSFEVDIQGAETDQDTNYVTMGSITAVNSNNVGRFEGVNVYPRFVRLFVKSLANDVNVTSAVITR